MNREQRLAKQRQRRNYRVGNKVRGSSDRPRMTVYRSGKNIAVQVIDDSCGKTLASASTRDASLRDGISYGGNCEAAKAIGAAIAERAKAAGVEKVRFDRGQYKYHGRIAALADAAREGGLVF